MTDLDLESKFYKDILGFTETWRGSSNGESLSWVNLKVPDGSDYIEFMLYQEEPAPVKRGTAHHLSLQVPDADTSAAKLKCNNL